MHEEEEPTENELREAEELARALERGHAGPALPGDALGAAALLRHAHEGATLSDERSREILADALGGARRRPAPARRFFLLSALGLSMAAAAAVLVARSTAVPPALLPAPPQALLDAQLDAARESAGNVATLNAEMRPYRESVYAALEERYRR